MRICFIPIDNRPVCYNLAKDIAAIDENIELLLPPREYLGDLTKTAKIGKIIEWMGNIPQCDSMVLSLDTIAYGGLIPSRRGTESFDEIKKRLESLKPLLNGKKVFAFSSIMRISNNNYNEEEKEYWKDYGKKIFNYSYSGINDGIPQEILDDYLATRKRNFDINKLYLEWKEFDTLIFSKDDCAPKGFNVDEARELEALGGKIKTGADEIPLTLLARAIKKDIKVFVRYIEPDYKNCVSNYEDVSIEDSVLGQLELSGFKTVKTEEESDLVLVVNNFIEKQGEHVMGWATTPYTDKFIPPSKNWAVADVRYANGADNDFVEQLLPYINEKFCGYAGWNTSANSLGSLLACIKVKYEATKYNSYNFNKLQMIRFLDDWAYQANIRVNGETPIIKDLMKPYENRLSFLLNDKTSITYSFPWNRSFEVEITIA